MIDLIPSDDPSRCSSDCFIATGAALAIAAAASAGSAAYAAKKQSDASREATALQVGSADKAANLQATGATEALNFQKQQAALDQQRFETTQKANYDQWAAGQGYRSSLGQMLGLPARQIPGYQSSLPGQSSSGMPTPAGSADVGKASEMFLSAMKDSGLDPVAVQGKGSVIADAVNKKYPGLGVTVDPKTDAVVWPGIGPLDVTIDSGKGGWSFRPSGGSSAAPAPAQSYLQPMSTLLTPVTPSLVRPTTPALRMPGY